MKSSKIVLNNDKKDMEPRVFARLISKKETQKVSGSVKESMGCVPSDLGGGYIGIDCHYERSSY